MVFKASLFGNIIQHGYGQSQKRYCSLGVFPAIRTVFASMK